MDFSAAPHYSVSSASDSGVDEEEEEEEEEDEDLSDEPTKVPKGKAKNEVPYLKRHLPKKCDWGNADQRGDDNDMYYLADRRSGSAKTDDSDGDISGKGSASARAPRRSFYRSHSSFRSPSHEPPDRRQELHRGGSGGADARPRDILPQPPPPPKKAKKEADAAHELPDRRQELRTLLERAKARTNQIACLRPAKYCVLACFQGRP
mgnify:CR=1 FL=1